MKLRNKMKSVLENEVTAVMSSVRSRKIY